jgi:hypothetical protein
MTERARIREEYKKKKRLPAPEIPKQKGNHKKEKNWILQYRYTKEVWQKMLKEEEEHEKKYGPYKRTYWWRKDRNNDWWTEGKYYDREAAEVVLRNNKRIYASCKWMELDKREYRIITKEELKKEKEK